MKHGLLAILLLTACGDDDGTTDSGVDSGLVRDSGVARDGEVGDTGVPTDTEIPTDAPSANCDPITARADWTLCGSTATSCEGVFEDGAGCRAFCAEVGLPCIAAYDDNEGMCTPNTTLPELSCDEDTGHGSDYCVCGGICEPSCDGLACGSDGCGGSCGACGDGESCVAGACEEQSGELKAFPSAFGAGAFVTGGRGGRVVHVTNLDNSGPGSFREALNLDETRTIVFDVAGVIQLEGVAGVRDNVTVAGQTAPAGGITIDGNRLYMDSVDNVVFRYIRFRGGVDGDNDSLTVVGDITNQIFDHCSFAFDNDETASWYTQGLDDTVDNLTVQRSFFGEGSKGSIIGGADGVNVGEISVLRNLFYNQTHRYPNVPNFGGDIEVINNVSWTAGNRLIRGEGDGRLNHIGNYNDYGSRGLTDRRMNMYHYSSDIVPSIYTSGNRIVAQNFNDPLTSTLEELFADNRRMWRVFQPSEGFVIGDPLPASHFTDTQHALLGAPTTLLSADDALVEVRSNVGANARLTADGSVVDNTDVLDAEWLQNVRTTTYVSRINRSEYNVPPIDGGEAYLDTDRDGMPDEWESAHGLNLAVDDSAADDDGDGYTNLEEFLNQVDL